MELKFLVELKIEKELRARFRLGMLPVEWKDKYPNVFDEDDLRLALSQPNYHFYEWCAAKYLYDEKGWFSLLEKYQFQNHKLKRHVVEKLKFVGLKKALAHRDLNNKSQLPDLLVYRPDFSDWFFCEVKGGKDGFGIQQSKYFEKLSQLSGKPIYWVKIQLV